VDDVEERGVDLPDVVEEGDALDRAPRAFIEARGSREHERIRRDAPHVRAGLAIVGVDGVDECFERGSGDALGEAAIARPVAENESTREGAGEKKATSHGAVAAQELYKSVGMGVALGGPTPR
jgi:hypothetical protein